MSLILSGTDGVSDVDGSAATPAIRGADANTGIFFPAADTIAFAEGGVEVARITNTSAWSFGASGTNTGTNGQVLTSAGSAAAPTWTTIASDPGLHRVVVAVGGGYGSTNLTVRRFQTVATNTGTSITYADSASLGATFTINNTGVYSITYADVCSGSSFAFGASLNSTLLSSSIADLSLTQRLFLANTSLSQVIIPGSITLRLVAGDVIRAQTSVAGSQDNSSATQFSINRVS